ncbi:MAG: hypothetical protein JWL76_614 [Thermoleophilia bacterium]|nr:hypothetical protein [Thermoleophilia bacterium]
MMRKLPDTDPTNGNESMPHRPSPVVRTMSEIEVERAAELYHLRPLELRRRLAGMGTLASRDDSR